MIEGSKTRERWWGRFELEEGSMRRWAIGRCRVQIERRQNEFRISHLERDEDRSIEAGVEGAADELSGATMLRLACRETPRQIEVFPITADRTIVARPEIALEILPSEGLTLFVGSPVWLRIRTGDEGQLLADLPTSRLSDTWFGATTTSGELAYASRTTARLVLERLEPRPDLVLTRVALENRSRTPLRIARISLPSPNLSVFSDASERLWTEDVSVVVEGTEAEVQVLDREPLEAGSVERLSKPRHRESSNILVRAMSALRI